MQHQDSLARCFGSAALIVVSFTAVLLAAPAKKPAKKSRAQLLAIPEVAADQVICFALYTVNDNVLKLTAQFYPLPDDAPRKARLEVKRQGQWQEIATAEINPAGWTAVFRVENWDMNKEVPYRVGHGDAAIYEGTVRRNR